MRQPEAIKSVGEDGYVIMLPVNTRTGEVGYDYVQYHFRPNSVLDAGVSELIDGWEYRPFKIVPAT